MDPETGKIYNPIVFFFQLVWVAIRLVMVPFLIIPVAVYMLVQDQVARFRRSRRLEYAGKKYLNRR
jgi:hypothetical protein